VTLTTKRPKAHLKAGQKLSVNQLLRYLSVWKFSGPERSRDSAQGLGLLVLSGFHPLSTVNRGDRPNKEIRHPLCHQANSHAN